MASNQKLEIEIAGNTVQLERSMKSINAILQASKAEATSLNRELKFDPTNTELLEKRQRALTTAMEMSKERASELRKDLEKIDPQVNPEGFVKLSRQVNAAESQTRSFERQLQTTDAKLSELSNRASTFRFDAGNGAIEFSNTLKGVDAALSTINSTKLTNFDSAKASVANTISALGRLEDVVELSERKSQLLRDALSRLDVRVDPDGFAKLQTQLQKNIDATDALKTKQQELYGAFGNVNERAKSFSFNPGDGIKTFANNIKGIKEALATLDTHKLLNFDSSTQSADASRAVIKQLAQAIELTKKKTERLKQEMRNINPSVDTRAFNLLDAEIRKSENELQQLRNKRVTIQADVGSELSASLSRAKQITDTAFSAIGVSGAGQFVEHVGTKLTDGLNRISSRLSSALGVTNVFGRAGEEAGSIFNQRVSNRLNSLNLRNVGTNASNELASAGEYAGGTMLNKLSSVMKSGAGTVASSVGSVGKTALNGISSSFSASASVLHGVGERAANLLVSPFKGIGSAVSNITKGAFLTVGQNITNSLNSTLHGVVNTMQDTVRAGTQLNNVLSFGGVDNSTIKGLTKDLQDYAKQTTYNASETYKVVASLSASNVEATKARDLTKSIGNSYALLGDGSRKLSEIGTIFSQINSATKLTAQDFNQLKDAGIGGALRQELMQAHPELVNFADAMSKGQISAEMVNEAITKIGSSDAAKKATFVPKTISEAFDSMQETIGQKFQGVFSNLNDKGINFVKNFTDAIDGINVDAFSNALMGVIDNASKGVKSLVDIGGQIGSGFRKGLDSDKSKENLKDAGDKLDLGKTIGSFNFSDISQKLTEAFIGVLPAISNVIKTIVDMFNAVNFGGFVNKILEIGQVLFDVIAKADFSPLTNALGNLSKAIGNTFKDVDFKAIFGVALDVTQTVVVGIIDAFTAVINFINSDNFKGTFESVWNGISGFVQIVGDAIKTMFENIDMSALENAGQSVMDLFNSVLDFFNSEFMSSLLESVGGLIADAINLINGILDPVAGIASDILDIFAGIDVGPIVDEIKAPFILAGDAIIEALNPIKTAFDDIKKSDFTATVNSGLKTFSDELKNAMGFLDPIAKGFGKIVGTGLGATLEIIVGAINGIIKASKPFMDFVGYLFKKLQPVADAFKVVADQIGRILNVLGKGIAKKLSELGDAVGKALAPAFDKLKKVLDPIFDTISKMFKTLSKYAKSGGDAIVGFLEKSLGVSENSLGAVHTNSIGNYDYSASSVQNNSTVNHVTMTVTGQDGISVLDIARAVKHELELGTV